MPRVSKTNEQCSINLPTAAIDYSQDQPNCSPVAPMAPKEADLKPINLKNLSSYALHHLKSACPSLIHEETPSENIVEEVSYQAFPLPSQLADSKIVCYQAVDRVPPLLQATGRDEKRNLKAVLQARASYRHFRLDPMP